MVDRYERNKDLVQELVESTATHVGQITMIITGAVAGVAREIGEIFTDGFEMREAARQAKLDEEAGVVVEAEFADAEIDHAGTDDLRIDDAGIDDTSGDRAVTDAEVRAVEAPAPERNRRDS